MEKHTFCFLALLLFVFLSCSKDEDTNPVLQPVAAFDISNTSPKVNELIAFTNKSQNASTYEWDFGDGNKSFSKDPSHTYKNAGSFTVRLTVTGNGKSNSTTKIISVMDATPIADFTIDKTTADIGEVIIFSNTSQNASTYEWDFGDGNMSTEINPTHIYEEAGNYTVKLIASNNGLNNSIEKTIEIKIPVNIFPSEKIKAITLGEIWGSIKSMEGYDFTEFGPLIAGSNLFHPVEEQSMGITFFLLGSQALKQDSDPVVLISVESPFVGTTEEGIGISSTLEEVKTAYGDADEISNNSHRYSSLGVSFTINSLQVKSITIFRP